MFLNNLQQPGTADHHRELSTPPKVRVTIKKSPYFWNVQPCVEIEFYMNPFKASDSMFMERRSLMQVCILNLTKMDKIYIAKILICFDLNLVDFHETN